MLANRDEYLDRPTERIRYWKDKPNILAGRDLDKMGTWMGVSEQGRYAAVTNFRNPRLMKPDSKSRGKWVSHFLENQDTSLEKFPSSLGDIKSYNPGNLLFGDTHELWYLNNVDAQVKKLEPGIYGLSNSLLDTPWPKLESGKKLFSEMVSHEDLDENALYQMMTDQKKAPDHKLPRTGISMEMERKLSSRFIKIDNYGTRCTSLLTIDKDGLVNFSEKSYEQNSKLTYQFKIQTT